MDRRWMWECAVVLCLVAGAWCRLHCRSGVVAVPAGAGAPQASEAPPSAECPLGLDEPCCYRTLLGTTASYGCSQDAECGRGDSKSCYDSTSTGGAAPATTCVCNLKDCNAFFNDVDPAQPSAADVARPLFLLSTAALAVLLS